MAGRAALSRRAWLQNRERDDELRRLCLGRALCAVRGSAGRRGHRRAGDRKSTRLNSSHKCAARMPSSARKKKIIIINKAIIHPKHKTTTTQSIITQSQYEQNTYTSITYLSCTHRK